MIKLVVQVAISLIEKTSGKAYEFPLTDNKRITQKTPVLKSVTTL